MSIQEYIESGIIETVILGFGSPQEELDLQLKRKEYPAVENYALQCEQWLEDMMRRQSVDPPLHNRQAFLDFIAASKTQPNLSTGNPKVVPLLSRKIVLRWAAAASVLLLLGSAVLNIYLYREFEKTKQAYEEVKAGNALLASKNEQYRSDMTGLRHRNDIFISPRVYKIALNGVAGKENFQATVFWNKETAETYLVINNLPAPPPGKQYQLWALVDGKPVDAGVLPDCHELCKLTPVNEAQAFAITLEKSGGSASPDLTQLYVTGKS